MAKPIAEELSEKYETMVVRVERYEAALRFIASCKGCKWCHDRAKAALAAK